MFKINDNYLKLKQSYLFSEIARKVNVFQQHNPDAEIIRMGIGDVTRPLCQAVIDALHKAVDEQASSATFRGYGPEQGYDFLRDKISQFDYRSRGIDISPEEIFVSDGAKSDVGNIGDILAVGNTVALTDPVYPVYFDTNIMAGRKLNIELLPCTADKDFVPRFPTKKADLIYLCYPNNPTGTTLTAAQLKQWVDYAKEHGSLILYDSAYEAYICDPNIPHSIYEIEGAKEVAIEFRSFSKTAGFTGLRCAYTVVPNELYGIDESGNKVQINKLWNRRQTTKFNGASYLSQRAAEATYSPEGKEQVRATINYYLKNAGILLDGLAKAGLKTYGGTDSPYVWAAVPEGENSWSFFDRLLNDYHIVVTPGVGFGEAGEGYIRMTAFNTLENPRK
ncbi:MAG: LL-diaminopimelate aminotransferase, partial [Muribaculaceae bacterium]|nr:LL-diaminopimelate aminotransferase [Muribaculaceae bacterium]